MKEITDILTAYHKAQKEGKKAALATIVKLEGSSYRRPGARMLITEDGQLTGAISGGCLEGDALRKALSAIVQQTNKLVTYDTTDEDDAKFGIQLGCNGIVHILFEPITDEQRFNPIELLRALMKKRQKAVLVTLFSLQGNTQGGTKALYRSGQLNSNIPEALAALAEKDIAEVFDNETSLFTTYTDTDQQTDAFIEFVRPPVSLVIAGAGNDAQPLAEIAGLLGWQVTIVDGRPTHATQTRFPNAGRVLVAKPKDVLSLVALDEQTAFVLMTHNYNYDLELLGYLLATEAAYIGTLGPRKKLLRMLEELQLSRPQNLSRVYGPVGLDIGAENAEEIAVSIIAEIKSVFSGASASSLKNKALPIHQYNVNER